MQRQISTTYDNCMNFLNQQHYQIIDIFLWDTQFSPKCKFLHFNASQWDSSWGMDLTERDFDIVCKKFMTACLTQCPVPEVISLLQTFTVLWLCLQFYRVTSAVVWLKEIFPAAFDGKINLEEPNCSSFLPVHTKVEHGGSILYFKSYSRRVDQQKYCWEVETYMKLHLGKSRIRYCSGDRKQNSHSCWYFYKNIKVNFLKKIRNLNSQS